MDGSRFDQLTRSLGRGGNRRAFLKGLLGSAGLAATDAGLRNSPVEAATRSTPTPKPITCPGKQTWNGSMCVCPDDQTVCGPDCCLPGQSVCCDNACCSGECYGEELCCEVGFSVCHNTSCCSPGDACLENGSCCTPKTCASEPPGSLFDCGPNSDGCGGSIDCTCPANWLCIGRETGNFCANLTNQCIAGITAASYGDVGLCAQTAGFCAISTASNATECVSLSQALCTECERDQDCTAITGGVCVQSWSEVCSTQSMCAQAL